MSRVTEAVELFRGGCACSQAILAVYGTDHGLDRQTAMQVASGFAGGMRMGKTCGAVTGAIMVLGLRHGGDDCDSAAGRQRVYSAVQDLTWRFIERNGSVACSEILGCDIATPEGMEAAMSKGLFVTICPAMVEDAAEILEDMMRGE